MTLPFDQIDYVFGSGGPHIVAEIGAADGIDTARYAARYPHADIYAFEPLPANVAKLNKLSGISIYPVALGAENHNEVDFWVSGGRPPNKSTSEPWSYSSSLLEPAEHRTVHPWCTFEKQTVPVQRLDALMQIAPDYIHMDVQGAELSVLEGAGALLHDVKAVWMEVSTVELYAKQPLYHDVRRFMCAAGFSCTLDTAAGVPSGDQFWRRP